uniref:Uncharacterized protein n=1 Tax=Ditylenchus dipsaci TaxID=166011 RepID=A0A915DZP1_9BILA
MVRTQVVLLAFVIILLDTNAFGFDLPAGLRPAKALGESEQPIVPNSSQASLENVRTPPNLSLRSRMIAALNSRSGIQTSIQILRTTTGMLAQPKKPLPQHHPSNALPINDASGDASAPSIAKPKPTVPPPVGKNYGVRTNLLTNLVDSKGRVMKGVNSVPIRVPSSAELRNAKSSRASASQVETDAEK